MLEKAVAALKDDKAKALAMFNKGEGGFKDRDLYVFCANASDGVMTAHPYLKGELLQDIVGKKGFPLGKAIMETAAEGKIQSVTYWWPRPGTETPLEKHTFYTKVEDQICGVGYTSSRCQTRSRAGLVRGIERDDLVALGERGVVEDGVDEVVRFQATRAGCRSCARSARRRSNWPRSSSRCRCRNERIRLCSPQAACGWIRLGSPQAYTDYAGWV